MPGLTKHEVELDPEYDHYDFPVDAPVPHSGHPGWTTPEQDAQVFQLRSMLEAEGYTDNLDTLTMVCLRLPSSATALKYYYTLTPLPHAK
jgi:hypothetical protein